ncbi:anti-sigma factor [Paenibacillus motobuensis]|uniref:Anti-sigma factor n=1 Tax=Paenibacillus motobuensis TaxID=295324 RepID=A0ABN0Y1C3_9BACL
MTVPWEDQEEDKNLTKVIKRAKRRTMIRNIIISLVVTVVVLLGGIIGNAQVTNYMFTKVFKQEENFQQITGPNLFESYYTEERGFLSGKLEIHRYKVIGGVPIPWDARQVDYNLDLNMSVRSTNQSYSNIPVPDQVMSDAKYEYNRTFNSSNGQREMMFYIPEINYNEKILNDLPSLSEMDPGKLVEMGISFDKSYSLEEVKSMLPEGLKQVWYWVDTYNNKDRYKPYKDGNGNMSYAIPEEARSIFGFGVRWDYDHAEVNDFIKSLQNGLMQKGKYYSEYSRIYDYLKRDKAEPDSNDVRIIGVVVTGTAEQLKSLTNKAYVRGAVLGAVVDKY